MGVLTEIWQLEEPMSMSMSMLEDAVLLPMAAVVVGDVVMVMVIIMSIVVDVDVGISILTMDCLGTKTERMIRSYVLETAGVQRLI